MTTSIIEELGQTKGKHFKHESRQILQYID